MVMNTISEAKSRLASLVEKALEGEEVIISRAGKPVVRLVACSEAQPRKPGALRGQIHIAPDFDEFSPELAEAFGIGNPGAL